MAINPFERLKEAYTLAGKGKHEKALSEYLWFHEHALEHDPSLDRIRMSVALQYWYELGLVYPKSFIELENVRDKKCKTLLAGSGNSKLFEEVVAINRQLEQPEHTCKLFRGLLGFMPDLAEKCGEMAMPALTQTGEFALARRFLADPAKKVKLCSHILHEKIKQGASRPTLKEAAIRFYVREVLQLLAILRGAGDTEEAKRILRYSFEAIESGDIRKAVDAEFIVMLDPDMINEYVEIQKEYLGGH
jgi:hypothetical protein